jgi:hypothetical protein
MFDKLKKIFSKKPEKVVKVSKPRKPKEIKVPEVAKTPALDTSAKDAATAKGDPYVAILSVDVDPQNIHNGSFELDWNDKFLLNLIKAGYKMQDDDTDTMIVDRWFHTICRNIVLEIYEQNQADPTNRDERVVRTKDLGGGRTEVS